MPRKAKMAYMDNRGRGGGIKKVPTKERIIYKELIGVTGGMIFVDRDMAPLQIIKLEVNRSHRQNREQMYNINSRLLECIFFNKTIKNDQHFKNKVFQLEK